MLVGWRIFVRGLRNQTINKPGRSKTGAIALRLSKSTNRNEPMGDSLAIATVIAGLVVLENRRYRPEAE